MTSKNGHRENRKVTSKKDYETNKINKSFLKESSDFKLNKEFKKHLKFKEDLLDTNIKKEKNPNIKFFWLIIFLIIGFLTYHLISKEFIKIEKNPIEEYIITKKIHKNKIDDMIKYALNRVSTINNYSLNTINKMEINLINMNEEEYNSLYLICKKAFAESDLEKCDTIINKLHF